METLPSQNISQAGVDIDANELSSAGVLMLLGLLACPCCNEDQDQEAAASLLDIVASSQEELVKISTLAVSSPSGTT